MNKQYTVCALVDGIFESEVVQGDDYTHAKFQFASKRKDKAIHLLGAFYGNCVPVKIDDQQRPLPKGVQLKMNNIDHPDLAQGAVGSIIEHSKSNGRLHYIVEFSGNLLSIGEDQIEIGEFNVLSAKDNTHRSSHLL